MSDPDLGEITKKAPPQITTPFFLHLKFTGIILYLIERLSMTFTANGKNETCVVSLQLSTVELTLNFVYV